MREPIHPFLFFEGGGEGLGKYMQAFDLVIYKNSSLSVENYSSVWGIRFPLNGLWPIELYYSNYLRLKQAMVTLGGMAEQRFGNVYNQQHFTRIETTCDRIL